jgi:hypothetical protein
MYSVCVRFYIMLIRGEGWGGYIVPRKDIVSVVMPKHCDERDTNLNFK